MEHNLEVTTGQKDDVTILHLKGDVTAVTGKIIEAEYKKASEMDAKKLILLFNGENYINSGGIAALILIASQSKKKGQQIFMTGLTDHFLKIFEMVGLSKYINIYPSEEAALAGFV